MTVKPPAAPWAVIHTPHPVSAESAAGMDMATERGVENPEHVVWAARAGDREATRQLFAMLLPRVRNLVRYLVRGDKDTDDITQEALVAIIRGLSSFRADGSLKSWVDRVVVRSTFAFIRKRRREPLWTADRSTESGAAGAAPGGLPDEYLVRRQAIAVLDELPLEQRHAVVFHHVLEMSIPEIADELEISPETVRSRLRLARTKLRAGGIQVPITDDGTDSPRLGIVGSRLGGGDR